MDEQPAVGADASVTVVLEYVGRESLCVQLSALVHQTAPPAAIWVSALNPTAGSEDDGAADARAVASSFGTGGGRESELEIAVVSAATVADAALASGTHAFGRLVRFQLALQATTRSARVSVTVSVSVQRPA